MEGIKEMTSSGGHPTIKIVLERCPRTEKALQELQSYHHHHPDHCSVCGSNEELIDLQNYGWTPLQSQLFKKRVLEWTLEVSGGGDGGGSTHDEIEWSCEGCMTQFEMLALVQTQITDLEKKEKEIVTQLKKMIGNRLGVISHTDLPGTETEATSAIFILDENPPLSTPMITAVVASDEDVDLDLEPVILDEWFQVDDALPEFPDDDDGIDDGSRDDTVKGAGLISEEAMNHPDQGGTKGVDVNLEEEFLVDEVQNDNPVGGVDLISQQEEAMHHSDVGDTMEEDNPQKSRRCKAQATHIISAILQADDDDDDEYWPTIESDTDSDEQNEPELEPNIGKKRDDRNGGGTSSNPPTPGQIGDDKHICKVCGKQVVNLSRHMEIHRSDRRTFSCETCQKIFSTEGNLSRHRNGVHLKQLPHKCQKCGKGFYNLHDFKIHLKMRIPCTELLKKRKFLCPICKGGFTTKANLEDHVRQVHNGVKRTKCPHLKCDYRTFDKTNLERHFEKHHPQDKKKISCTICNEKFSSVKDTLAHINGNHICEFCNKTFPNKADLDEHQRTNHTGDQPYFCSKCGTKFNRKNELGLHLRNITCNLDEDDGGG